MVVRGAAICPHLRMSTCGRYIRKIYNAEDSVQMLHAVLRFCIRPVSFCGTVISKRNKVVLVVVLPCFHFT